MDKREQEGRASFFEKKGAPPGEAKKILLLRALALSAPQPAVSKSFLLPQAGRLFFKKEAL
jgi:hypothetical protein